MTAASSKTWFCINFPLFSDTEESKQEFKLSQYEFNISLHIIEKAEEYHYIY